MAAGSGELAGAARGGAGGAVRFTSGRETAQYMGAAASSCTPADAEAGATPQTSTSARDRGRADDGPVGKGRARPSANPEAPRGVRTSRVASVCATPGEGAALGWRAARKPRRKRGAGAAHDVVPWRGAAPSGRSISLCPGSDAFISKILN
jgi:hypothetical protein